MTHTLIPHDGHYQIQHGILPNAIHVKFINDEEMVDDYGNVYVCWRDGVIKEKGSA